MNNFKVAVTLNALCSLNYAVGAYFHLKWSFENALVPKKKKVLLQHFKLFVMLQLGHRGQKGSGISKQFDVGM